MSGDHRGLGAGDGLDLDRIRPYEPGDDVRRIDWNATARSLVPQVREDVPDRQLTAWLLLDTSAVDALRDRRPRARRTSPRAPPSSSAGPSCAARDRLGIVTFGSTEAAPA